jgi:hypothetical protein
VPRGEVVDAGGQVYVEHAERADGHRQQDQHDGEAKVKLLEQLAPVQRLEHEDQ